MQHLAIIPDGNRRWASANRLESFRGHHKGMEAFEAAVQVCIKKKIKYLTFYTFSLENFKRSEIEKRYLFTSLPKEFTKKLPELIKNGVKIQFLGEKEYFPNEMIDTINEIEEKTKHLNNITLSLLFCYGGRQEIVNAVRSIAQQVLSNQIDINNIDENTVKSALLTGNLPEPDLIIRTGGSIRLSNFLLFQSAYSELKFLNCYWPEVDEKILTECVDEFKSVKRNFGK